MLGKRCRTIQRTASISQNMGPHYLHHHNYHQQHDVTAATKAINHADAIALGHHAHAGNSQVPAIIPQIIGFNPMIKSANYAGGGDHEVSQQPKLIGPSADFNGTVSPPPPNLHGRPQPHDMYDDDPKHHNTRGAGSSGSPSTKRSQITPRSALQTLLAAARQITYSDQSSASNANNYPCKSSEVASKSSFKNNQTSPSCSSNSTVSAAKQGSFIWQGLTVLGEATISKELPSSKQFMSTPKASKPVITTQAKGAHAPHEFSQNYNIINEAPPHEYIHNVQSMSEVDSENIFDVEGTSCHSGGAIGHPISCFEPTEDHRALYLATSPLTADFIPNLATSMSFLDSCYLCKRPLGQGRDIFMYRGENAFCSMECRDKQMRLEDRKEKLRSIHSQMNKLNVEKQGLHVKSSNAGMGSTSTNTTSCYHPHQQPPHSKHLPHHHQQYAANHSQQAVAYNNKQHRISLLMPAA